MFPLHRRVRQQTVNHHVLLYDQRPDLEELRLKGHE